MGPVIKEGTLYKRALVAGNTDFVPLYFRLTDSNISVHTTATTSEVSTICLANFNADPIENKRNLPFFKHYKHGIVVMAESHVGLLCHDSEEVVSSWIVAMKTATNKMMGSDDIEVQTQTTEGFDVTVAQEITAEVMSLAETFVLFDQNRGLEKEPVNVERDAADLASLQHVATLIKDALANDKIAYKRHCSKLCFIDMLHFYTEHSNADISAAAYTCMQRLTANSYEMACLTTGFLPRFGSLVANGFITNSPGWILILNCLKAEVVAETLVECGLIRAVFQRVGECQQQLGEPDAPALKAGATHEWKTIEVICLAYLSNIVRMKGTSTGVRDRAKSLCVPYLKGPRTTPNVLFSAAHLFNEEDEAEDFVALVESNYGVFYKNSDLTLREEFAPLDNELKIISLCMDLLLQSVMKIPSLQKSLNGRMRWYTFLEVGHFVLCMSRTQHTTQMLRLGIVHALHHAIDLHLGDDELFHQRTALALQVMLQLSFLEQGKDSIRQCDKLGLKLKQIAKSNDGANRKMAQGLYFKLFHKDSPPRRMTMSLAQSQHCMISYCWDDQPFVLWLAKTLTELGVKVWLDINNMSGSTLEAMASAVEEAYVIVVVLSEPYKNSGACRTEAEYAYKLRKPIVPVKAADYDATGWLGALIGTRLWFGFGELHAKAKVAKVRGLRTELHRHKTSSENQIDDVESQPTTDKLIKKKPTLAVEERTEDQYYDKLAGLTKSVESLVTGFNVLQQMMLSINDRLEKQDEKSTSSGLSSDPFLDFVLQK